MESVLSARFYGPNKPLKLEQVELPNVGDDEVLVSVKAAGICHSDILLLEGKFGPGIVPMTLGHEASGVIVEKGKRVDNLDEGDRVGVDYMLSCGICDYCKVGKTNLCDNLKIGRGAWTEKFVRPAQHVYKLPPNLDFTEAAIMSCAIPTAYHAMKFSGLCPDQKVLIYGLGGVGMSGLQWAKIFGSKMIIAVDLEDKKLQIARQMGATDTVNAREVDPVKRVKDISGGGVDFGFEFIGLAPTARNTIDSVRKGGKAVLVGMCTEKISISPVYDMMLKEVQLLSPSDHVKSEMFEVYKYVKNGEYNLSKSVSHKLPLKEVNEGVRILREQIGSPARIVLEP